MEGVKNDLFSYSLLFLCDYSSGMILDFQVVSQVSELWS